MEGNFKDGKTFQCNREQALSAVKESLDLLNGYSVSEVDVENGKVIAKHKMSLLSWGETVNIKIKETKKHETTITISSHDTATGTVNKELHWKNINLIMSEIAKRLNAELVSIDKSIPLTVEKGFEEESDISNDVFSKFPNTIGVNGSVLMTKQMKAKILRELRQDEQLLIITTAWFKRFGKIKNCQGLLVVTNDRLIHFYYVGEMIREVQINLYNIKLFHKGIVYCGVQEYKKKGEFADFSEIMFAYQCDEHFVLRNILKLIEESQKALKEKDPENAQYIQWLKESNKRAIKKTMTKVEKKNHAKNVRDTILGLVILGVVGFFFFNFIFSEQTWEEKVEEVADSYKTETEKHDEIVMFAVNYDPTYEEKKEYEESLVSEYRNGNYLSNLYDEEYALSNIFKATVVEKYYEDSKNHPMDSFAFDFLQNTKYVYRGVDTPNSESVKSNESQMDKDLMFIR